MQVWLNSEPYHAGRGGNLAGDLMRLLVWLANDGAGPAGIEAGRVVTTGSSSGTRVVSAGTTVRAIFANIGTVEIDVV